MKNMMLITIRDEISQMYAAELEIIFEGYLNIIPYSFENPHKEPFNKEYLKGMDLIVITSNNVFSLIRNHIDEKTPVVYIHFTFMQDKIDLLKLYPRDTNAYIGFKSYSASFQTVSLLYELGLNNLNLRVYDPNYTNPQDIDVAIASDNSNIFPPEITNILNIGQRKIAFNTIMDIATSLIIMDDALENRIYSYCGDMAIHDNCLNYFYDKSSYVKVQLQTIINCIDDAFIMLNHHYTILNHNSQLLTLFKTDKKLINSNLADLPEFSGIYQQICSHKEFKNELLTIENLNKKILLSKEIVKDRDNTYEIYILILKDVTKVINLENTLRKQLAKKGHVAKYTFESIRGKSPAVITCIEKARKIAAIDKPTLIIGDSGTGKELFAQSIHNTSVRKNFPFIAINCAALAPTLLESELFGYEEGSFTGAKKGGKLGLFETAHKGTLFLDEICEMNLEIQAKLLRVLEEKEIMRIGSNEIIAIDVKIIAATNKNMKDLVDKGLFRLDLFFRLNTVMLRIPPLKERHGDVLLLTQHFLQELGAAGKQFSDEASGFLLSYPWQGNVRELRNCIEYMASVSEELITTAHIPEYMLTDSSPPTVPHSPSHVPGSESLGFHDLQAQKKVLELLLQQNRGRRGLVGALQDHGIRISEYRLRSVLEELNRKGYVFFGKGRSGAVITTDGRNALLNGTL